MKQVSAQGQMIQVDLPAGETAIISATSGTIFLACQNALRVEVRVENSQTGLIFLKKKLRFFVLKSLIGFSDTVLIQGDFCAFVRF